MITNRSVIAASTDLLSSSLSNEVVVLGLHNGRYYGFNAVAAFVWKAVQEPITFGALHASLVHTYDVAPAVAAEDLTHMLEQMKREGLVRVQNG